jgi:hypothetical protein
MVMVMVMRKGRGEGGGGGGSCRADWRDRAERGGSVRHCQRGGAATCRIAWRTPALTGYTGLGSPPKKYHHANVVPITNLHCHGGPNAMPSLANAGADVAERDAACCYTYTASPGPTSSGAA